MGLFVWYFGVDRRYEDVAHHTILLGPRYRELLRDIFDRKRLAPDFSLYLHRPTATDPSLAPEAATRSTFFRPCPTCLADRTGGSRPNATAKRLSTRSRRRFCPACRGTSSPRGLRRRSISRTGSTPIAAPDFGLEPILTQSAWFRPHNASEDVRNLFLVGAGTHPGAGLPGVLSSARVLDKVAPHASVFV